jgi:3-deoxy-manno-octulosonate cytidylyltransferase (CMP-KDO synthetase)
VSVIGVIPARYASTRFPGKPLVSINGLEMIAWVIRGAQTSQLLKEVWVATDDERIAKVAEREKAKVAMTDPNLPSGTDRIFAAAQKIDCDILINIQGDEPLVSAKWIDSLAEPLIEEPKLEMATLAHPISEEEMQSMNSVKVVMDQHNNALYFSRFPIPYSRDNAKQAGFRGVLKHIGMYGYRKSFLKTFCAAPQAEIEKAESLEQLRALHLGAKIRVVPVQERSFGVDAPEDLKKVEEILKKSHRP